jgi:hypothetical protein
MIWRLALVIAAIGVAWVTVAIWERRRVSSHRPLASGLTLVTGADCRLCPLAVAAVGQAGIPVSIVDISDAADPSIKSIPTALVADADGRVIARRSGRSAITAMPELISLARSVA